MSRFGKLLAILAALLVGVAQVPSRAMAQPAEADYSEFYEALEPHGRWIEHARYGTVWSPYAQEEGDWRPYSRGQWVYTEEHGWYWQSEEEFGWAVYHYGRWRLDDEYGWIWIPGTEWGPAWVAWRQGEDTVGWAPLPPEADWDADAGLTAYSTTFYDSPRYASAWCFVPAAMIAAPYVWRHFSPRNRSVYWLGRTRHIDGFRAVDRRVFNRGVDRQFVERFSRRPVPVLPIRQVPTAREGFRSGNGFVGAYRPRFDANPGRERVRPNIRPDNRSPEQRRAFERRPDGQPDFRRDARPIPRYEPPREARREPPQRFEPPQRPFADQPRREARPDPLPQQREFRREPQQRYEPPREARREPPQRFDPPPQRDFRREPPQQRFEPPRETRREPPPQQREFRREPPPQREVRREPPPQAQVQRQAPPQQQQPQQRGGDRQPHKKSPQEEQQERGRRGPG